MLTSWRSRVYAGAGLVFGLLSFWWLFSEPVVPVDLAVIDRGEIEVTVSEEGVAQVREVYVVSAPVSGLVQRSPLEVGDAVSAGQSTVATIMPSAPDFLDERAQRAAVARVGAAEAGLQLAVAGVERAEAELEFARSDLARAESLVERRTVSERSRDEAALRVKTAIAALHTAEADVKVRRQELDTARAELIQPGTAADAEREACCVSVPSPIDGRVLAIQVESAQVVAAGTPLLEIGNPGDLEIVVDLLSTDAVRIETGDLAYIDRWGGAEQLTARVSRIDPAGFEEVSALGIEEQRVTVRLDLDGSPERFARLGHDFRVFARIVEWRRDDAMRVPISALFRHGDDWAVFVAADGAAERRLIAIGQRNDDHAELIEGLAEGDRVVLHPSDRIEDGTPVEQRSVEGASE
ncbi:MAG: efflux RND transporter periplasmic adaptor subunit [Pseudomonadota bacterium]